MEESIVDEMPVMKYLFGYLPLRYGCLLIGMFGLGSGVIGLLGVILYGIGAFNFLLYFVNPANEHLKKTVIATLGLTSLMMTIKNSMLVLGVIFKSVMLVYGFVCVALILISAIFLVFMLVPLSCFFGAGGCLLEVFSWSISLFAIFFFSIFISIWTYFMIAANSLRMEWNI